MQISKEQNGAQRGRFNAVLRITGRVVTFSSNGVAYLKLRLSSWDSDWVGFRNLETVAMPDDLGYLDLVEVSADVWKSRGELFLLVDQIEKAVLPRRRALPPLETLPHALAIDPVSVRALVRSVRGLSNLHLQEFMRRVLERKDRVEVFLRAPASRRYHHSFAGGLLAHSLEVARGVVGMIQLHEPHMARDLQETGFVAGLLHDIGKVFTFTADGQPTAAARLSEHDAFTLEACASGLAYLDHHCPEIATTLRHIWTCASPGSRYGTPAALSLARYVRDADGQNAMVTNQTYAFQKPSRAGFAKIGANRYWQPAIGAG